MSTATTRLARRRLARNRRGVTLVELLIVLAVIGGLAVLYMVNTGNVFTKTADTQLLHDLANARTAATSYATSNGLSYLNFTATNLTNLADGVTPTVDATANSVTITMTHTGQQRKCSMTVGAGETKPTCTSTGAAAP